MRPRYLCRIVACPGAYCAGQAVYCHLCRVCGVSDCTGVGGGENAVDLATHATASGMKASGPRVHGMPELCDAMMDAPDTISALQCLVECGSPEARMCLALSLGDALVIGFSEFQRGECTDVSTDGSFHTNMVRTAECSAASIAASVSVAHWAWQASLTKTSVPHQLLRRFLCIVAWQDWERNPCGEGRVVMGLVTMHAVARALTLEQHDRGGMVRALSALEGVAAGAVIASSDLVVPRCVVDTIARVLGVSSQCVADAMALDPDLYIAV